MTKKTPWFNKNIKPVRIGWYEVKCKECEGMHYWDGDDWRYEWFYGAMPHTHARPWRGLMK